MPESQSQNSRTLSAGTIRERLRACGFSLPEVVPPVAAYVPAVRSGQMIYTSGQLPMVQGKLPAVGIVGAPANPALPAHQQPVDVDTATECARICALNALAAIAALVDLEQIAQIVKVTGYVASHPSFTGQPGIINGASELLGEVFGSAGEHARAAVGVASLPLGAPVEIDLTVAVKDI